MKYALALILAISGSVMAAPAQKKTTGSGIKDPMLEQAKPTLSTNISFEDMVVGGKYQYSDEAVATVEDDKGLEDLLSIRNDFKDRLKKETKRK